MKKTLLTGLLSAWLFVGATCSATDITALIAQVQAQTAQACAFVPTAQTIVDIFQSNNAALQNAAQIAAAICASVAPHAASETVRGKAVTVGGMAVDGYFVR